MSPETAGFALDELDTVLSLEHLADEWRALWERAGTGNIFLRPEWLLPWWRHFGAGKQLSVLTARTAGRLTGLLPLCAHETGGRRELMLLGTGNTDRLDVLVEAGCEIAFESALQQWLSDVRESWDVCVLAQLPASSPLLPTAAARGGSGQHARNGPGATWREQILPGEACAVTSLRRGTGAELLGRHGAPARLAYYRRRAQREGVQVRTVVSTDIGPALRQLYDLHTQRWAGRELPGVLADQRTRAFLDEACTALARAGLLELYLLERDGSSLAAHLGFVAGDRALYYIGGFAPAHASLSPGTLLIAHAIDVALRRGLHWFDFLRGREAYKYAWSARDEPHYLRLLERC